MKKLIVLMMLFLGTSCSGQHDKSNEASVKTQDKANKIEPQGSWKVDKEFDAEGNLIRYDSIYSWSSSDDLEGLSFEEKDSLMQTFKSRFFTNFSSFKNEEFEDVFSQDSLFSKHFFNDDFFGSDFGNDFMNLDKIRQQMLERQKNFLEKYQSEFIKPENEN
ncbi:hypothetical protein [Winogradskyella helgolandensis]|uniref:hypothetical protein n=1 Tax=Winogradskyella helgolandensis TaxID=2697010 RepID=UPI0015BF54C2|nr:hypothetical protein [Winogradskyella helgolandensis]